MNPKTESKEFVVFLSIIILTALIFSFVLFGITGVRVVFGILLISLPFYFMFNTFELSESEKLVFSILLGLTIFPSLVYILGLVISFKASIIVVFAISLVIAFALNKIRRRKTSTKYKH